MRILIVTLVLPILLLAQKPGDVKDTLSRVAFDTDEGTFMCVDVSPNGKALVFDLLGDLYTLPISGGKAEPLLTGRAWDRCPRFSPDGQQISFISDRVGRDNIWVLNRDSRKMRQLTDVQGPADVFGGATGTPEWLPGGAEISYGLDSPTEIHIEIVPSTGGEPRSLLSQFLMPNDAMRATGYSATFLADGRTAFFSVGFLAKDFRNSRQPVTDLIYQLDRPSNTITLLTKKKTGRNEFKPQASRSGRLLAYARRELAGETELRVRDLKSGLDRRLTTLVDADDPDRGLGTDGIPAYAFTPDDKYIVIWYAGKLHKVSVDTGTAETIPFSVHVAQDIAKRSRPQHKILDGPLDVRALRWPTVSRDEKQVIFSAVGSLWLHESSSGKVRRLTRSDDFEYMPALSDDGKSVAYVAFSHGEDTTYPPGRLMIARIDTGETQTVMADTATYYMPAWSPDGTKLAVVRETGSGSNIQAAFGWIDLTSRTFHDVASAYPFARSDSSGLIYGQHVTFSDDGTKLSFERGGFLDPEKRLSQVDLDGRNVRDLVAAGGDVLGIYPSPDCARVALVGWDYRIYMMRLPLASSSQAVRASIRDRGVEKLADDGALFPHWSSNDLLTYGWLNEIFQYRPGWTHSERLQKIQLSLPRRQASHVIAFRNARLITVTGSSGAGPVIEAGTIVIEGRRIAAVGRVDRVSIPSRAEIIDASGLTIMPGLVDSHYHGLSVTATDFPPLGIPLGPVPSFQWALLSGVTTAWDAGQSPADTGLARIELIEAGRLRGARWFTAERGMTTIYSRFGNHYDSFEEIQAVVRKKVELGAEECLKNYGLPERTLSGWLVEAARGGGVCVATHTNNMEQLISRAGDGYMVDHATLPAPSYRDVIQFLAQTDTIWTPHILLSHGTTGAALAAIPSFLAQLKTEGYERAFEKLDRFGADWLKRQADEPVIPFEYTSAARSGKVAATLLGASVRIAVSADNGSPFQDQFEMWALERSGIKPGEVIRAATVVGAEKLGVEGDIGSLAPGKIADFLVLTANPLEQIRNTFLLKYTVVDGIVYDSNTLDVLARKPQ